MKAITQFFIEIIQGYGILLWQMVLLLIMGTIAAIIIVFASPHLPDVVNDILLYSIFILIAFIFYRFIDKANKG